MPTKVFAVWKRIECLHASFDEFVRSQEDSASGLFDHAYTNVQMNLQEFRIGESRELIIVDRMDLGLNYHYDIHDLAKNVKASGLQTVPKFLAPYVWLAVRQTPNLGATVYVYEPGIDRCCSYLYRTLIESFIENSMYSCDRLDDKKIVLCR